VVPDHAIEAALAAAVVQYVEWQRTPNREAYVNLLANNVARRAIAAAAPLIAAQVLREASEALRPVAEAAENNGDPFEAEYAAGVREAMKKLDELARP
jgi:hypothetical protein